MTGEAIRRQKRPTQKESVIEAHIKQYLALRNIFFWKVKTTGTYDPAKRIFRATGANYMKGVSDILGVLPIKITPDMVGETVGIMLAIEVKSKTGKLRPEQVIFQQRVRTCGGVAFVARGVEDVQAGLGRGRQSVGEPEAR